MIKVDGLHVVTGACNNGTTALVTRDGELLMFGKDTAHADASTGNFLPFFPMFKQEALILLFFVCGLLIFLKRRRREDIF